MEIVFDLDLSYRKGFSYHSLIYFSFSIFYAILGCFWVGSYFQHNRIKVPLFTAISILWVSNIVDQLLSGLTVLVLELSLSYFPSVMIFVSNLFMLWNIAGLYMIFMFASKGWCISRPNLQNGEKQMVILVGSAMMLVEVILIGSTQLYTLGLIIAYILVSRLYKIENQKVVMELERQIQSLQRNRSVNQELINVLNKKYFMMRQIFVLIFCYMVGRVVSILCKYNLRPFYVVIIEESVQFSLFLGLFWIFRLRKPIDIYISIQPNGRLLLVQQPQVREGNVEMVFSVNLVASKTNASCSLHRNGTKRYKVCNIIGNNSNRLKYM
jgi:hypothetical protein